MGVLGAGCSPLYSRDQETSFEGPRKTFSHWDDNGRLLEHLKSPKQQNFLIGDRKRRLLEMLP
jgi:hypothetical protein